MRKLLLQITILSFVGTSVVMAECINCSADVLIKRSKSQNFSNRLLVISSLPLIGYPLTASNNNDYVIIRVETVQEYADANHITSFDIAKYLDAGFGNNPEWSIKKISASVEKRFDDPLSNVGTIGH